MRKRPHLRDLLLSALCVSLGSAVSDAQGVDVRLRVEVKTVSPVASRQPESAGGTNAVVAWLTPLKPPAVGLPPPASPPHTYVLAQKNKQFVPHLLVVPTGSSVEFPNLDPFFHNVFSLFNGRRFDLGLYEAGSKRLVRFDHDGASYIFCNIHPEMGAVVVSLSTPFFVISAQDGALEIKNVPPGDYNLSLWSENVSASDLDAARVRVHVGTQPLRLAPIMLKGSIAASTKHLNKFGEEYKPPVQDPY